VIQTYVAEFEKHSIFFCYIMDEFGQESFQYVIKNKEIVILDTFSVFFNEYF